MHAPKLDHPTREFIAALPAFVGLDHTRIYWVGSESAAIAAQREIGSASALGFDTESKPIFTAGVPRTGPHLIQFATEEKAFCIPAEHPWTVALLAPILQSKHILKVGFGLASDRRPLHAKFGIQLKGAVDLAPTVRRLGYRQRVGLQAAVAIVLGQRLAKSKSTQTSNWAARPLRPAQLSYAANDAYASLCVFNGLSRSHPELLQTAR